MSVEDEVTEEPKTKTPAKKSKKAKKAKAAKKGTGAGSGGAATFPRHTIEKALRITESCS
jgi:hypothetical protein